MIFSRSEDVAMLCTVLDRIVPVDGDPSATGFGADAYVRGRLESSDETRGPAIVTGLWQLEQQSLDRFGTTFIRVDDAAKDALLAANAEESWFIELSSLV